MDMRTKFEFTIDDDNTETVMCHSWQESLEVYLTYCNNNGFDIDEKLKKQIIELAKFRRVSV